MKRKRCGLCLGCTKPDCGLCVYCKDKTKFGGPGKKTVLPITEMPTYLQ